MYRLPPVARRLLPLLAVLCGLAAGCSPKIETQYGRRKGPAPKSVNGTAVLGELFEAAGHRVHSWYLLSPRLQERADCIVWFPDDFEPPSENAAKQNVRQWLDDWLLAQPGRTLVYVGRDFDAAAWYWDKVKPDAPAEQAGRIRQAAAEAKDDFEIDRQAIPANGDCGWFIAKGKHQPRNVRTLEGPWAEGVDASKVEIQLNGRIDPADSAEVLLGSRGDALVTREQFDESQLIVVANGSFLLNVPLVNHEHRKLAGKLTDEVDRMGPSSKTVVFLESRGGGPSIRDEDPSAEIPTGMEIFLIWPSNWILLHFTVVGVIFCFSRWPLFGLPRQLDRRSTSDFGNHVQALAEMLQRSRDQAYAMTRFLHYQQTTKSNE